MFEVNYILYMYGSTAAGVGGLRRFLLFTSRVLSISNQGTNKEDSCIAT
jgi:hypothetical protein